MWRLLIGLALLGLAFPVQSTMAQEECPGGTATPEETASVLFSEFLAGGQWDLAYQVLHPEAQLRVLFPAFAAAQQARAVTGPMLDVEIFPSRVAPGWTWGITGVRFTDVAEVPVRFVRARGPGIVPIVEIVPLVRVAGCWRWLPPVLP